MYEIFDADGDHAGDIEGQFAVRDTYTVSIDDASDIPKEAVSLLRASLTLLISSTPPIYRTHLAACNPWSRARKGSAGSSNLVQHFPFSQRRLLHKER